MGYDTWRCTECGEICDIEEGICDNCQEGGAVNNDEAIRDDAEWGW